MTKRKFTPIKVRKGAVELLTERFGCSRFYVDMALTRDVDNPLYDKIREAAKEYPPEPALPRIRVKAKDAVEIAERAECSLSTVDKALRGVGKPPLADKIRAIAKEYEITPCEIVEKRKPLAPMKVWHGAIGEIAERMGCDYDTVYKALRGETRNELADKIRKVALKREDAEPIKVRYGGEIELAKHFGCGVNVVREALKGSQISPLRIAIREAAKDNVEKPEQPPIKVKYGGLVRLAKEYGCSGETVRLALKGDIYSPLATKIREKAHELGLVIEKQ